MPATTDGSKNRLHALLLCALAIATILVVVCVNGGSLAGGNAIAVASNHAHSPQTTLTSPASSTALISPTTTPTPTCCMVTGTIQTTCSFDPGTSLYTINLNADIVNSCGSVVSVAANFYLEVSQDNINFGFIRRTSIQTYVFQPGHNYISDLFDNQTISPLNHYYRIRMQLYACGIYEIYSPSSMLCGQATQTSTPLPTSIPTSTSTPMPSGIVVGHVAWQGSTQPDPRQAQTATLALCMVGSPQNYGVTTDAGGYFTLTTGLPDGVYNWWLKNVRTLANSGSLTIAGGTANQEMGVMASGDATNDNAANVADFNSVKTQFGQSGTGLASDFDNNGFVNAVDFNLLKIDFGRAGALPNCP